MKTMTCRELGRAREIKFRANTFEEIAQMSKQHGMEMLSGRRKWASSRNE